MARSKPKDTASMARNKIKRCLNAILDPHPQASDVARIWAYFQSSCAYCGTTLERKLRHGHLDHAVPASRGGTNSIFSHVLACGRCNGDEKREEAWESFLTRKCLDSATLAMRRTHIIGWFDLGPAEDAALDPEIQRQAHEIVQRALASFEQSDIEMRQLRDRE